MIVYNDQRAKRIVELKQKVNNTQDKINMAMDTIYHVDYDKSGLASSDIVSNWLQNMVAFEGAKAEMNALDKVRIDFDELYAWYAPLGATMKKLERKIGIAEKEYLQLLGNLGLAKLRQQNVELQSNLKVTEPLSILLNPTLVNVFC